MNTPIQLLGKRQREFLTTLGSSDNPWSKVPAKVGAALVSLMLLHGCSSAYYGAMEKLGYAKRDILASRIKDARTAQQDAKEQFANALERFQAVVRVDGGELESKYKSVQHELDASEKTAKKVHDRIASVEDVSEALFDEWESELNEYTNDKLKRESAQKLSSTRQKYSTMIAVMKRAESKLEPALQPLRDNVLYLKHNLNAKAIASLESEQVEIERSVQLAVNELERSIAEADRFIATLD